MITRIVKMTLDPDKVKAFEQHFDQYQLHIRNFPGNQFLKLYQDIHQPHVFFTYSFWNSEDDLNQYRNSELFAKVWAETKPMFAEKAQAWSVACKVELP
jgi:(4S)-4-hydroxy-5-phosphonooxypentane-2,3-dione isomerase